MAVVHVIEDKNSKTEKDGQINALSWQKKQHHGDELLAIATVSGLLKIVDVKRNRIIARMEVCQHTLFEVDWGIEYIVACSENGLL